jgi:3-hydroxyacyl-CoA dehydrogenase
MRWGYAHELGPFELWDSLGVRKTAAAIEASGIALAPWVREMLDTGNETFYRADEGVSSYYDPARKTYVADDGQALAKPSERAARGEREE